MMSFMKVARIVTWVFVGTIAAPPASFGQYEDDERAGQCSNSDD